MDYKIIEQDERYFCGIEHETELEFGENSDIYKTWNKMFHEAYGVIKMKTNPHQMIGLNCYDFDFKETNKVTYYALAETIDLIPQEEHLITKKIPKGRYICFTVSYFNIGEERKRVYEYCKNNQIHIHMGFDYENFLNSVDYQKEDAVCELCIKLEDD
jgi:predicted transcriptional regulator YdeE